MLCLPFEISSTLNLFCVEMKKTEVRIWILDFVCYPTFEYLIGHKWRIQNTPPHIADFCQAIYQDQIKLYETFQNLATFNQMFEQKRDKCVKNLLTNNVSISVAPLFWHHQDYPITTSDMFYNSAASRKFWDICLGPRIVGPGCISGKNIWTFPSVSFFASGAQLELDTYSN